MSVPTKPGGPPGGSQWTKERGGQGQGVPTTRAPTWLFVYKETNCSCKFSTISSQASSTELWKPHLKPVVLQLANS